MLGEILSLETAEKLARYDKAIKYIKKEVKKDIEMYEQNDGNSFIQELVKTERLALSKVLKILEGNHD